ncbi:MULTISPECIES: SusC/RagA family TonB-linked outer membrane protein [Alistipes]|uniref:SusC/RagA family TonB-linked outer membrane protein n=1 Tax=Alistipes TaxID=239759 RepID=UPI0018AA63BC|nr:MULTISPECIES: SusC/RagA family TonB-linked outer membrane protein [Alistipes]MBD9301781.1 SusC/RagA family TonB-linked outer membrane protein [Alistipes senegalensis]MBQ7893209.1 SusC/RagA family TonB-linked outer membrane protein [Alistipes sp.]MDY4571066.1 SusC/RagA family TonB-linked outer membrane protein [Alistipes senegalensis]
MKKFLPEAGFSGRVMRRLAVLLVIWTAGLSAVRAQQSQQTIAVNFRNATVQQVFTWLDNHTQYDFVYNNSQIESLPRVSMQMSRTTVVDVVKHCLRNSSLSYQIRGNMVVIRPADEIKKGTEEAVQFSGVVYDENGLPLAGVSVVLKQASRGAVTGPDGKFTLKARRSDDMTLSFSFLGMKNQEIAVFNNGKQVFKELDKINVHMDPAVSEIGNVVVTGILNIAQKSFSGSSTTITGEQLKTVAPQGNALSAIQIFEPSFRIAENLDMGSNPNALPQMYVRGRSGIGTPALDESLTSEHALKNDPNQPIFMLDGYEVSMEKIYDLDIERIETYTILKDAAATAMYGSRAANGVVVITTKPLPAGRLNVTYSGNFTINAPDLSSYNLMNAREKLEAERLAGYYDTDDPSQIATKLKEYNGKLQNIERGIETDWLALPLRTSFGHKHSIGIAGASDAFRYGLDLMYDDQEGVMKGQNRKKMSAALNLQYQYKGLTFRNQMTTTLVNSQESPYGTFSDYVRMNPYDTYLDENGNIGMNMATWHSGSPYRNPMYDATLGSFDKGKRHEFYDQFDVRYYLNKKINFKANVALGYIVSDSDKFTDPAAAKFQSTEKKGQLTTSRQKQSTYDISLNGYYNDQIGRHNINFVVGLNIREEKTNYEGFTYSGFPEGGFSAPGYAKDIDTKSYLEGKNRLFGALAVLNYSYNDVIFADLSGRIDGSSQFGSNKRFAPFFSTGAGVNVHNLKFFKENTPWLTQFKLRGTYGMTGKVSFPSYAAQNKYEMFTDWQYPTGDGVQIMYLGNPNLKWERTLQTDLGFEFEILKGLFYAKYNYYIKDTHDNIADMFIPTSSGFTSYKENIGRMENRGHEIKLQSRVVNTRNTIINLIFNGASNKGKLKKISNSLRAYNDRVNEHYNSNQGGNDVQSTPLLRYVEGGSLTGIYAMRSLGIDPATGKELYMRRDGSTTFKWDPAENVLVGDTEPSMSGSFGLSAYWKGFTLDTYFMYEWGGQRYNQTLRTTIEMADILNSNCDRRVLSDRWIKPGDIARFRDIKDYNSVTRPTSRLVQNYSYLNMSSLSVGYEFKRDMIRKLGLYRLKLQFNCRDLFTASSIQVERGLSSPYARAFTLSVNASF